MQISGENTAAQITIVLLGIVDETAQMHLSRNAYIEEKKR
jgi:hypothetical protein